MNLHHLLKFRTNDIQPLKFRPIIKNAELYPGIDLIFRKDRAVGIHVQPSIRVQFPQITEILH
jgi:hypothetical protein